MLCALSRACATWLCVKSVIRYFIFQRGDRKKHTFCSYLVRGMLIMKTHNFINRHSLWKHKIISIALHRRSWYSVYAWVCRCCVWVRHERVKTRMRAHEKNQLASESNLYPLGKTCRWQMRQNKTKLAKYIVARWVFPFVFDLDFPPRPNAIIIIVYRLEKGGKWKKYYYQRHGNGSIKPKVLDDISRV